MLVSANQELLFFESPPSTAWVSFHMRHQKNSKKRTAISFLKIIHHFYFRCMFGYDIFCSYVEDFLHLIEICITPYSCIFISCTSDPMHYFEHFSYSMTLLIFKSFSIGRFGWRKPRVHSLPWHRIRQRPPQPHQGDSERGVHSPEHPRAPGEGDQQQEEQEQEGPDRDWRGWGDPCRTREDCRDQGGSPSCRCSRPNRCCAR